MRASRLHVGKMIYTLTIFNRQGVPLFYREWAKLQPIKDIKEQHKLMFGFLFSLKQLVGKMSPRKCVPLESRNTNPS